MALNCDNFKPVMKHKNNFIMRYNCSLNCDICEQSNATTFIKNETKNPLKRMVCVNFVCDEKCDFLEDIIVKKVKVNIVDDNFVTFLNDLKVSTVNVTTINDDIVPLMDNLPLNHCDICSQAFVSEEIMRRHKIVHFLPKVEVRVERLKTSKQGSDIKEDKAANYSCRLCNVTYTNQRSLLSHKFFDHLLQIKKKEKVQKEKRHKKEPSENRKRDKSFTKQLEKRRDSSDELLDGENIVNTSQTLNRRNSLDKLLDDSDDIVNTDDTRKSIDHLLCDIEDTNTQKEKGEGVIGNDNGKSGDTLAEHVQNVNEVTSSNELEKRNCGNNNISCSSLKDARRNDENIKRNSQISDKVEAKNRSSTSQNISSSSRKRKGSFIDNTALKNPKEFFNSEEKMKTYVTFNNRRQTQRYKMKNVLVNIERINVSNIVDSKSIKRKKPVRKPKRKVVENPFYEKSAKVAKYEHLKNPFFENKKSSDINKNFVNKEKYVEQDSLENAAKDSNDNTKDKDENNAKEVKDNIVKDQFDCLKSSITVKEIEIIHLDDNDNQDEEGSSASATNNDKSKLKQLFPRKDKKSSPVEDNTIKEPSSGSNQNKSLAKKDMSYSRFASILVISDILKDIVNDAVQQADHKQAQSTVKDNALTVTDAIPNNATEYVTIDEVNINSFAINTNVIIDSSANAENSHKQKKSHTLEDAAHAIDENKDEENEDDAICDAHPECRAYLNETNFFPFQILEMVEE